MISPEFARYVARKMREQHPQLATRPLIFRNQIMEFVGLDPVPIVRWPADNDNATHHRPRSLK